MTNAGNVSDRWGGLRCVVVALAEMWHRALSPAEITQLTTDTASKFNLTLSEV